MKQIIKISIFSILCTALASSCSWWGDSDAEATEQILSVAVKSPSADFSKYLTFCITDSILYTTGDESVRTKNTVTEKFLKEIKGEFEDCGYAYEQDAAKADLIVDVSYIVSTTTSVFYDPYLWWDWGYWWDSYYYPFYDPFYPYYPFAAPVYYSSYSAGMVIIDVVDMTDKQEKTPIVWHGIMRALLDGEHKWEDIDNAVEQCFDMLPPVYIPIKE